MKTKSCKVCKSDYTPQKMGQKVCSPVCAISLAISERGKAEKVAQVKDRRETNAKLTAMKTRSQWMKEAKIAAQRARRLEELAKGSGCISCGRSQEEVAGSDGWKPGGAWDGGHFLSKGARPELALEPLNIWLQCKSCNAGSGKYARKGYTVNQSFRANLIDRIGLDAVEVMEADHAPRHYSIDEIKASIASNNAKTKQLKASQA